MTKTGEGKALAGTLAASLRHDLGVAKDFPVFVPYAAYTKNTKNVSVLVEGYAFVSSGLPEVKYFALENKHLVARVLSARGPHGMRVLHTIPNHRVQDMQQQLRMLVASDVEEGMTVKITGGCYAHIEGQVVYVFPDRVAVRIQLRSIDIVTVVSKSMVSLDPDDDGVDGASVPYDSYEEHVLTLGEGGES